MADTFEHVSVWYLLPCLRPCEDVVMVSQLSLLSTKDSKLVSS